MMRESPKGGEQSIPGIQRNNDCYATVIKLMLRTQNPYSLRRVLAHAHIGNVQTQERGPKAPVHAVLERCGAS
ncbi:hypothetical protein GCM10022228_12910 [Halomonas cibimaris]|uniref:Uncharacterized protein n=1 Tax=Halomonas cibimaris TaxID=657012 RepID=A0ABP7LMP0_9GAMM